ncbi:basic helix-loop-helix protein A-like [Primulina huaijiensis]|uniref:basic helix-loop-helix protein A-like n=1 Tax=Primulina huaijiensis TaxID=1492673 RepID=UPI003CC716EF
MCSYVWGNLFTWRSKKQTVVARSSVEAELRSLATRVCEGIWLRQLLIDLRVLVTCLITMYCDYQAAISISKNPVQHDRTKHIEIDRHFINEKVEDKVISICYVPSQMQAADILTKLLRRPNFYMRILHSCILQTCVCIPVLDGVVELGSIKWVEEDIGLIQDIKSIFCDHSKSAISDYSTSTPSISFALHPTVLSHDSAPPMNGSLVAQGDDESGSYVDGLPMPDCEAAEANCEHDHQLVEQLDMPVGIGVGLRDYESGNLDPYLNVLEGRTQPERSCELSEVQWWHTRQEPMDSSLHPPDILAGISSPHETTQENGVYSRTVSTILQSTRWSGSSPAAIPSASTTFSKYSTSTSTSHHHPRRRLCGSSQWTLKYILFTVPFLLNPTSSDSSDRLHRDSSSAKQEELGGSHVLAERRRREKLNERFVTLRSLVPFVTKMDKASVLGDTIEYLKHQCKKIQELEERTRQMEAEAKQKKLNDLMEKGDCHILSLRKKKKRRIIGDGSEMKNAAAQVEVSIIESDALVEIQCLLKEGLLINVIKMLRKFTIEVITVQSSMENGVFAAQLRAKVGEDINGRKASIMEVKRAINQIIYS